MNFIYIGDRVFPGFYRRHSVFENAINFFEDGRLVSLVQQEIGNGPVNITLEGDLPLQAQTLKITETKAILDSTKYIALPDSIYSSTLPEQSFSLEIIKTNLLFLEDILKQEPASLSLSVLIAPDRKNNFRGGFEKKYLEQAQRASHLILENLSYFGYPEMLKRLKQGIKNLKGLGYGLTPGGDDFIAGVLFALNFLEMIDGVERTGLRRMMAYWAQSRNLLSAAFLNLAREGFFFESLRNLVLALAGPDPNVVRTAARNLLKRGATSGADLSAGFFLTLKKLI